LRIVLFVVNTNQRASPRGLARPLEKNFVTTPETSSERELIVIVRGAPTVPPQAWAAPPVSSPTAPVAAPFDLAQRVERRGGVLKPGFRRFSPPANFINPPLAPIGPAAPAPLSPVRIPDLSVFYRVEANDDEMEQLALDLSEQQDVEAVYIQPRTELPSLNNMRPTPVPAPSFTPNFSNGQGYLNATPDGIDARFAWSQPGGQGQGVRLIDIEQSWNLAHEGLLALSIPLYAGAPRVGATAQSRDHGTAVLGVTSAAHSGAALPNVGVLGICPQAGVEAVTNAGGVSVAEAIVLAADRLNPGDILILEMHRPGPRFNYALRPDQLGFIAVEWWPYDLAAIQYASGRGIIVVEAAGNGAQDLDDPLYNLNPGFGPTWTNPFTRTTPPADSGAILVGAGAPPSGTYGPARSRLDFSNYGRLLDAQGWGREVTTCGYGDLQGGSDENLFYTSQFSGTSSATPIVAGALACVQGARLAHGRTPLMPAQMRTLLRASGALQTDGPRDPHTGSILRPLTERIGNLPDLRALIPAALALP